MRTPRKPRAPRPPRKPHAPKAGRKPRGPRVHLFIYDVTCKDCGCRFSYEAPAPAKSCIRCKSSNLDQWEAPGGGFKHFSFSGTGPDAGFIFEMFSRMFWGPGGSSSAAPPPRPAMHGFKGFLDAANFIAAYAAEPIYGKGKYTAGEILENSGVREIAYRLAARKLHPDAGGSHEMFVKLQSAKAVLDQH